MLTTASTFTLHGIGARPVRVEVDVRGRLPGFSIAGLPDVPVRNCRERVHAALASNGFEFPRAGITINLNPIAVRRSGAGMDLAIAAALLAASDQLEWDGLSTTPLLGELALDGTVRPINGVLQMVEAARARGLKAIVVPADNGAEAALVEGIEVVALQNLGQLPRLARGWRPPRPTPLDLPQEPPLHIPDLADLRGQARLRRALEVSAAGGHSLLLVGPPGAGKSLAAARLPSILPDPSPSEALEVARIASACGRLAGPRHTARPFRTPHWTISPVGMIGSGRPARPGEVTLAHRGVLFLDDLTEFHRDTFDQLRAALATGAATITRADDTLTFPARFLLVVSAEVCPCVEGEKSCCCHCDPEAIPRHRRWLVDSLTDAIAIRCHVSVPSSAEFAEPPGESSAEVRRRVSAARERQEARLGPGRCNADMTFEELWSLAAEGETSELLGRQEIFHTAEVEHLIRIAHTVADLDRKDTIRPAHMEEALRLQRGECG
jgi:magnesium chelatase family protein